MIISILHCLIFLLEYSSTQKSTPKNNTVCLITTFSLFNYYINYHVTTTRSRNRASPATPEDPLQLVSPFCFESYRHVSFACFLMYSLYFWGGSGFTSSALCLWGLSMLLNVAAICSLLLVYNIQLSEYTTTYLTILTSGYFGCFQILVLMNFF